MRHHTWSADFMCDALWSDRRFRAFNINDFNRESLRIEIDTSLPSARIIRALDELVEVRGAPRRLRLDNGPDSSVQRIGSGRIAMPWNCSISNGASQPRTL